MNQDYQALPIAELRRFFFYCHRAKRLIRYAEYGRSGKYKLLGSPRGVGTINNTGYASVKFNKKHLKVHRIVWALIHGFDPGENQIDHINGDKADNRIENLRLASASENQWNAGSRKTYAGKPVKVPYKGVYMVGNTIIAKIKFKGKTVYLGSFPSAEKAAHAYAKASMILHREYANKKTIEEAIIAAKEAL